MKKKQFKFVYFFADGEAPDALYLQSNNVTNAKREWDSVKKDEDVLFSIFLEGQEIWRNKETETGYHLGAIK